MHASYVQAMKAGNGTRLYIPVLFIDHLLSLYIQGCADVDDLVVATRRQEPYIIAMETGQTLRYRIYIESQCLLSVNSLNSICNIAYALMHTCIIMSFFVMLLPCNNTHLTEIMLKQLTFAC